MSVSKLRNIYAYNIYTYLINNMYNADNIVLTNYVQVEAKSQQ